MSSVEARALRLFDVYVDLPAAERAASLAALRAADLELHGALAALLSADACARPLDRAPIEAAMARMQLEDEADLAADRRLGTQVGPWRIVGVISRGGMGMVYRVERADGQYAQTAALKYVRADVSSPDLVAAFLEERNVLASLRHPDIVPLLDGGVDAEGQPWFVMQQIDGETIDRWCDDHELSVRQRVELFLHACDAVVYAHGRGILHQDIKPSSLLVTPDGRTQLIDFGLSMPLAPEAGDGRRRLAVTSGYAAPEVLRGDAPGFGVDVYALGVLLVQLLCGQWPVPPNAPRHVPRPPSALAAQAGPAVLAARGVGGRRALARQLRGELDSIALRCVEADPDDRYARVEDLRHDLRNWLSGRPVAAYGDGVIYRLRCLVRRHAPLAAAAGLVAVASLGFGGLWLWQQWHAERERIAASHVDRLLESALGVATLSGLGDMPLTPAALLERSEASLRDEATQQHPDARARGLSVLARSWAALGDYGRAERLAREAGALASGNTLLTAFNQATLAQIQNAQAHHAEAEASVHEGLALLPLRLSGQHRLAHARLLNERALAQSGQGDSRAAFETLAAAIAEAEKLPPYLGDAVVARLLTQRGTWYRWRSRMDESAADLLRAISLTQTSDPVIADDARQSLVRTIRASRRPGRESRSLQLAEELLASRRHTLGERHPQTGSAWAELAFIRLLNTDNAGAQTAVDNARGILQEALGDTHPALARVCVAQAFVLLLAGRIDEAIAQTRRGLEIYRASYGSHHEFALEAAFLLASLRWGQFSRTGDEGARQEAIELSRATIDESVAAHGDVAAVHRLAYAQLLAGAERYSEASEQLQRARADALRQYGRDSQEMLHIRSAEISIAVDGGGEPEWIERSFAMLLADLERVDTLYARAIAHSVQLTRGGWLRKQGRGGEARIALLRARDEAVKAGQPGWIAVADLRLRELDREQAAPAPRHGASTR